MLQEFPHEELHQRRVNTRLLRLQEDGGTAHTARNSIQNVREIFPERDLYSFGFTVTGFISMRLLPMGLFEARVVCE
jgi:hypothetical protein